MKFSLLLILITTSAMAAQDSKGRCGNGYQSSQTTTGNEYCAQSELGKDAKNKQIAGSVTHGVVAVTCFAAFSAETEAKIPIYGQVTKGVQEGMTQACTWSDVGGNAADGAFALAFNSKAQDITGQMTTSAASLGMSAMMATNTLNASHSTAEGSSKEAAKKVKGSSLIPAIMNTVQTGSNVYGATQASKMAKQGEANKMEAYVANGNAGNVGGNADTQNIESGGSSGGGSGRSNASLDENAATADAVKELLANSPAAPVLKKFAEMTKQPTDQLVDAVVKGGINPVIAAAAQAQAGGLMDGATASNVAALANMAESEIAKANGDSENAPAVSYASNSKGGGSAAHEDGLPDLASMMAQFMPKDENGKPLDPKAASAMKFGARKPASENDGFHPASISIFEVVDARYAMVLPKFLAGNAVEPRTPASLVPGNMYLKK